MTSLRSILALFLCAFGGLLLAQGIGMMIVSWISPWDYAQLRQALEQASTHDPMPAGLRHSWRLIQVFSMTVGFIVVPFLYIRHIPLANTTHATQGTTQGNNTVLSEQSKLIAYLGAPPYALVSILLVVFMSFAFMVVNAHIIQWNESWQLPAFLSKLEQWMQHQEHKARMLTQSLTTMHSPKELMWVLFVMAIVPAVAEEFFFRGLIQPRMQLLGAHLGIWISAAAFSFFHLQFYGFVPRMLLGAFFGYLFWYSSSLWLPMIGHFVNNGIVCVQIYFQPLQPAVQQTANWFQTWIAAAAVIGLFALFIYLQRNKQTQNKPAPKKWKCAATTPQEWEATLIKDQLLQHDIPAVVLKQKDSLYLIGYFKVYVPNASWEQAQTIAHQAASQAPANETHTNDSIAPDEKI